MRTHSHPTTSLFYIDSVCGFDHADLDEQQEDWHTHLYPYKLASYQKTLLSEPVTLGVLHFNNPTTSSAATDDLSSGACIASALNIMRAGRCDAVVIWVDYELTDSHSVRAWSGEDFPNYLTVNVKFFADSKSVQAGNIIVGDIRLDGSKGDFVFGFELQN